MSTLDGKRLLVSADAPNHPAGLYEVPLEGGSPRPISAPPRQPSEQTKLLRQAYAKAMKDPELLADAAKQGWTVDPLSGEQLESMSKDVVAQPRDVIERMKWVMGN